MKTKTYTNKLGNFTENNCQLWNEQAPEYGRFKKVLDYYEDYIHDYDKLWNDILLKIKSYSYINKGMGKEGDWEYNSHVIFINNERFEYKTGLGINCTNPALKGAWIDKIVFDAIISCIGEASLPLSYDEDEFLNEFGYTGSAEQFKKGIHVYQMIKENRKKIINIFGYDVVENIHEIIEL